MKTKTTITTLAASLCACFSLQAAILTVDNNPGAVAMFDNLQDAHDAATDGDTILVAGSPNAYRGKPSAGLRHEFTKRLTIIGPGFHLFENKIAGSSNLSSHPAQLGQIDLYGTDEGHEGSASGTKLYGIQCSHITVYPRVSVTIERCHAAAILQGDVSTADHWAIIVKECHSLSVVLRSPGSMIKNSLVSSLDLKSGTSADRCVIYGGSGLTRLESLSQITNSIFGENSTLHNPAGGQSALAGEVSNCISLSNPPSGLPIILPSGNGNINADLEMEDVFLWNDSPDGKYQLKPGSPAIGAGTAGGDIGAFSGANPYKLSGVPAIPRLTHLIVPPTATSTSGLRFEVEAQAFGE